MALNINVPQANQTLAITQPLILNNFNAINTAFAVDHVNFNDPGQGKHNKITFPVQAVVPVFAAGDLGLFSFLNATTTKNELNVYKANNAGYVNVPFTASILSNSAPIQNGSGWSYLPSGLIIQWGTVSVGITLNNTITLAVNFPIPFPTAVLNVQATQNTVGSASRGIFYNVSATNPASFTIQTFRSRAGGGATNEFYYFAIGY
jgi:hypothetical protein